MADAFDTPEIIPARPEPKPPGKGFKAHAADARDWVNSALDEAGRPFIPVAAAWKKAANARDELRTEENLSALMAANREHRDAMRDLRRDRRAFEKARDEVKWWNVFNGERRAARAVVKDSRQLASEAKRDRAAAKAAYPMALPALAVRCHAVHVLPTGIWAVFSESLASTGAFTVSVTAVAVQTVGVALGLRHVSDDETDVALEAMQPSQEERDLLHRLDPKEWHRVAEPRGLADVVASGATLTESGITAKLTLNGVMTLDKLKALEAQLRAALRLREGTRMELREGKTGGHARLTLRTRSPGADVVMSGWKPGDPWAINTVTGETVPVPLGKRILFAGASGAGKSWSARPLMAEASEYPDHRLVIIDRKYVEARNWEHRARVACELDDIRQLFDELEEEGERRLKTLPRGKDTVDISPSCPRITVFVDEGGEMISDSKTKHPKDEEGRSDYGDIMVRARTVARKYRASEIILVWCTQKPALSGDGHGLDSQIAGQLLHRLSLTLATSTDTQVVFGNDAVEKGWKAHELPMPGFALLRNQELGLKSVPQMLKMRAMSPKDVIALPNRPVWSRSPGHVTAKDISVRKRLEAQATTPNKLAQLIVPDPWADVTAPAEDAQTLILGADVQSSDSTPTVKVKAEDRDDQIMEALTADPCQTLSALARTLGASKSVIKKALDRLANDGLVARDDNNCWHPVR